jgi:hypothetical protein
MIILSFRTAVLLFIFYFALVGVCIYQPSATNRGREMPLRVLNNVKDNVPLPLG